MTGSAAQRLRIRTLKRVLWRHLMPVFAMRRRRLQSPSDGAVATGVLYVRSGRVVPKVTGPIIFLVAVTVTYLHPLRPGTQEGFGH